MDRRHRLTSARAFGRAFSEGRKARTPSVVCFAVRSQAERPARVGVTASKRVGTAVRRNRAKRVLREAARADIGCIPEGTDVVLVATPDAARRSFDEIRADVRAALTHAGATQC